MFAKIFLGPIAGALGGWLGGLPFRATLAHRSAGIGIGVLVSVVIVNLGLGFNWSKFPALASIGPSLLDPFVFGLLASAALGGFLALTAVLHPKDGRASDVSNTTIALAGSDVFLCYRRADSEHVTGRIYDRLWPEFGREHVHRDVDSIPAGVDFRTHIESLIARCGVCLVVIGPLWASIADAAGKQRLSDASDHVRQEIETALARNIMIIPILVGATEMPKASEIPESLRELPYRNSRRVRPDPDFHHDMDRVMAEVAKSLPGAKRPSA